MARIRKSDQVIVLTGKDKGKRGKIIETLPVEGRIIVDGVNIATDASLGNIFTVTLAGNRTLDNPTNPSNGQKAIWRIKQDATGSRTLAFGAAFRFGTDITGITLTTTASKTDYIGAVYNGTDSKWDIIAFVKGY